jgi:SAM-dependent methyltransferase
VAEQPASHPDRVRQLFDAKAPSWSAKYAPDGRLTGRLTHLATVLSHHVSARGRVLDLGCGTGELARAAAAAGMLVTACDISAEMLRRAAASDRGGLVEWIRLDPDWRTLPFVSTSFDAIVAASVLEYVDAPGEVLHECARVLRPGGVALCTVPDVTHPVRWLEWPAAAIAQAPLVRTLGRRSPRLDAYLTYLTISRQRHSARWWRAAAAQADLLTWSMSADMATQSPLRLLVLQRPEELRQRIDLEGDW